MKIQSLSTFALIAVLCSFTFSGAPLRAADAPPTPPPAVKPATPTAPAGGTGNKTLPARPGDKNSGPVIAAGNALLLEYNKIMKDKKGEGLREKSDYFLKDKPEGVTPEAVLIGLERRFSPDGRAEAYIKWQLLSGVEGKFPPELKARAIKAYRAAPQPLRHPGLAHSDLDRTLNRVGIMKKDAEADINKEYGDVIKSYRLSGDPILDYRDELYSRLSPDFDTFSAALGDAYERVTAGAPANEFWSNIATAMRGWSLSAGDPRQVRMAASAVEKIRETNKDERYRPYGKVAWNESTSFMGLKWVTEASIRDDKSLEDTVTWLNEHANSPAGGGGLGFKDQIEDKKPKK